MNETVVNYIIEGRPTGRGYSKSRAWLACEGAPDEEEGRRRLQTWLGTPGARRGTAEYRLIKRTAVIVDEVVVS